MIEALRSSCRIALDVKRAAPKSSDLRLEKRVTSRSLSTPLYNEQERRGKAIECWG